MDLKEYFENTKGFGVLSTADNQGKVDAAVYSRPHVMEDGTIASVMRDRLTHENLKTPVLGHLQNRQGTPAHWCRRSIAKR